MRFRDLTQNPVDDYLTVGKIPNVLHGLAAEARKAPSFEDFEKDFVQQIKHGVYWHWTADPHFKIDPTKGPRDMSSMAGGEMSVGKLMITSHLAAWEDYDGPEDGESRPYVALIDMSEVPRNAYWQVNRGFGNEFFVDDPSRAKVLKVMKPATAKRLDREWRAYLPYSKQTLRRFYEVAISAS